MESGRGFRRVSVCTPHSLCAHSSLLITEMQPSNDYEATLNISRSSILNVSDSKQEPQSEELKLIFIAPTSSSQWGGNSCIFGPLRCRGAVGASRSEISVSCSTLDVFPFNEPAGHISAPIQAVPWSSNHIQLRFPWQQ
ncbi:hypothetical protein KUCAC02_004574, partial [Chaenocephalus aceratus]